MRSSLRSSRFCFAVAGLSVAVLALSAGARSAVAGSGGKDIVDTAVSAGSFQTLVAAVKAAGLVETLKGDGPYTVFAPNDEAFERLPEGTVQTLLKPENKSQLAFILTNHVAPANYPEKQWIKEADKGRKLYMASGKYLDVENREGEIYVGGTKILKTVHISHGAGQMHLAFGTGRDKHITLGPVGL